MYQSLLSATKRSLHKALCEILQDGSPQMLRFEKVKLLESKRQGMIIMILEILNHLQMFFSSKRSKLLTSGLISPANSKHFEVLLYRDRDSLIVPSSR